MYVYSVLSAVCVCVVIPFILDDRLVDAPAGVTRDEGHTRLLHLPSAVLALISIARRIEPSFSLVNREVELHFQQSRVWINRVWLPRSAEHETCFLPCPSSRLKVWLCEINSAISFRVSLLIIHTQAVSDTCSRDFSRFLQRCVPKCLLQRIFRHKVSTSQGSSSKGYCLFRKADPPNLYVARFPRIFVLKVRDKASCTINLRDIPVCPVVGVCYILAALVKPLSSSIVP